MSILARSSSQPANLEKMLLRLAISRRRTSTVSARTPSMTSRVRGYRKLTLCWRTISTYHAQRSIFSNWKIKASLPHPAKFPRASRRLNPRRGNYQRKILVGVSNRRSMMPESIKWWTRRLQMLVKKMQDKTSVTCTSKLKLWDKSAKLPISPPTWLLAIRTTITAHGQKSSLSGWVRLKSKMGRKWAIKIQSDKSLTSQALRECLNRWWSVHTHTRP